MNPVTHEALDRALCGTPTAIAEGRASVRLTPGSEMAADRFELVHGGFVFGLADHAAMLAVNHPNVVLGGAEVRFLAPVSVGDHLLAEAEVEGTDGKKLIVNTTVFRVLDGSTTQTDPDLGNSTDDVPTSSKRETVMTGRFTCFSPHRHVLDRDPESDR